MVLITINCLFETGWLDNAGSFDKLIPLLSKGINIDTHIRVEATSSNGLPGYGARQTKYVTCMASRYGVNYEYNHSSPYPVTCFGIHLEYNCVTRVIELWFSLEAD